MPVQITGRKEYVSPRIADTTEPSSSPNLSNPGGTGERWIVIAVVLGAVLMPLNSTMIAVALPEITDDLGISVARSAGLVTA